MAQTQKARVVVDPTGVVRVHVAPDVLFNLPATQDVLKSVLGRLGCAACCSGHQIIFQQEASEFKV